MLFIQSVTKPEAKSIDDMLDRNFTFYMRRGFFASFGDLEFTKKLDTLPFWLTFMFISA